MKTLLELEPDDCRYPMNDGGPYLFCGEATPDKQSYCAEHHPGHGLHHRHVIAI